MVEITNLNKSRTRISRIQLKTVQDAIRDLDNNIIEVQGEIGRRLQGNYNIRLLNLKTSIR